MQKENKENTIDNTNTKSNKNKDGIYKASRAAVHFHVWLQNESGGNTKCYRTENAAQILLQMCQQSTFFHF